MKTSTFLLIFLLAGLTTVRAEDDLPKREKFSRYEPMIKHSPFAVATAGAPVGATPDFAKDLYVANAAHSEKGDFVTIASTTNRDFKEYLTTNGTVHGYSVPNIEWSDRVGETKVTIAKDGQVATLSFNEAILSQAIQNPAVPQNPVPGMPGRPPTNMAVPHPYVPQIPTPPPHTRGLIRRNATGNTRFQHPQQVPQAPARGPMPDEPNP